MKIALFFVLLWPLTSVAKEEVLYLELEKFSTSRGTISLEGIVAEPVGYYARYYTDSSGFEEWYVGPRFILSSSSDLWIEIGVGVGRESEGVRRNAYYWAENENFYAVGDYGDGASGQWHQNILVYKTNGPWGIGLMEETDLGLGPRLEFKVSNSITLSTARLRERSESTWLISVMFTIEW
jgi:hypothetical protein